MTDLDDAVAALVEPVVYHHEIHDADDVFLRMHETKLPCLLDQLQSAVHSSTSGQAGGGSKAGRSVLNSDALYKAGRIRAALGSWCRMVGIRKTPARLADMLTAWHTTRPGEQSGFYVSQLDGFRGQIINMLNPGKHFQYATPCVVCAAEEWFDEDGLTHKWPLLAQYPPEDVAAITITCRACGTEWDSAGVGELIEEVEAKQAESV